MRYATATDCVPEPCVIAGAPLRPFSLGHHLLFRRLGLPFAKGAEGCADCEREDLILGLAVCALPYYEALDAMLAGVWPDVVVRWRKSARGPWWNRRRIDWDEAEDRFGEYLATGYEGAPLYRRPSMGGISLTAPWEQILKVRLVQSGFSEREVMEGYLPARWYDYWTAVEQERADKCQHPKNWRKVFFTREDAELIESVKATGGMG